MDSRRVPSCWLVALLAVALLHLALLPSVARADEIDDMLNAGSYAEGEVVAAFLSQDGQIVAQSDAPYEVMPLMRVTAPARRAEGGTLAEQSEGDLTLSSVSSATLTTEELLRLLAEDPNVAFAEPNYTFSLEGSKPDGASSGTALSPQADATAVGDLKSMQWGNWTTDQTMRTEAFTTNPSVNVPNFAASLRGANMSKPVVVALLDTAVDNRHPDLTNVLYHFSPEQQAALGCYDMGYNAGNKGARGNYYNPESVSIGHGTHTAGIIGAEWNGFGTSGVASDVRIVSIDFASEGGAVTTSDAICAFEFVDRFNKRASDDERIRITSNSWGSMHTSRAIDAAVRKLGETWNTVSVFSAGNDGRNNDHYERANSYVQNNPYAVIVANSSGDEVLNDSSAYGTGSVDLAAPGTRILSTMTDTDAHAQYLADATRSIDPLYVGFDGDSEPGVTVSQLYQDDKPSVWHDDTVVKSDVGTQVNNVHACGPGSLKVDVDQAYSVDSSGGGKFNHYDVKFDVDLTGTDIADRLGGLEDLHLGLMFAGGTDSASAMVWSLATNLANIEFTSGISPDSRADWLPLDKVITEPQANDKAIEGEDPPTGAALHPEGNHLVIKLRVALPAGCTTFYVDSLGLGTQTSPYGFKTGTSMSTPVVSGAGAVLASQGHEGTELASLLRSKVRVPDPALAVKTGGIFDFLADGTTGASGSHALGPDITGIKVDGTTLTVTGANFGAEPASVNLARYVVGAEDQPLAATVASWSDEEVRLTLDAPIEGILRAVLTNSAGKWDTQYLFVSKGASVFEQDLPFDPSAGDAFVYGDAPGDWETKGPLVGLGCKLYHLPAYGGDDELAPGYSKMLCFDLKKQTWSELPALPEWLSGVSAVMHDGKIVVEGATMYELETGEHKASFPEGEAAEERVYEFDPADGSWTKASADGMLLGQTIVNDDGNLKLAGGSMPDPEHPEQPWRTVPAPVTAYDLSSGAGDELCALPLALSNPQVAAHDKTLLICSDGMSTMALAPAVIRVREGQATELKGALPAFVGDTETITYILFSEMRNIRLHNAIAPTSDGFVLVGPPAADGASDTYVLRDDSEKFEPYGKRSSEDCVYSQAACTYRGRLFVIGAALLEPNNRLFRATAMDVPEYPGDIPCDVDPEPEPTPGPDPQPEPTPDPQTDPQPETNPTPDYAKGNASQAAMGTATTTATRAVPKTGDESSPLFGMLLAGIVIMSAGMLSRASRRS